MNIGDVITTAEGLDALAQYSVVADDALETWTKDDIGQWVCAHGDWWGSDVVVEECTAPLTVVALPSRPERVVKAEALREAADALMAIESDRRERRALSRFGRTNHAPRGVGVRARWLWRRANRIEAGDLT